MRKLHAIALAAVAATALACSAAPDEPAVPAGVADAAGLTPSTGPASAAAESDPADTRTEAEIMQAEGIVPAGTWEVGTEVKPGTYIAEATEYCYWARLRNFDGDLDSIVANGNLDAGQRGRITVKKSDKGLELNGDCVWVRSRK